ncbi:DUF2235 domain-containing protein [Pseudomonas fulva]|uniref:T6SS phospholipase effector Tle1-like catalytic domain-containing protein n=1 Tax=Pseudomonas fulva TaxID=47880 RepID=UPI0018A98EF1|nr:DUF2235 domain-containing protein [Pseudomonas fulva]MBF8638310.1 DUF2235 domain-containing protein [Pseudomonas fulva]MBF8690430.1 DUF2235 domain-containing protein [Pseudomonas fulva]
MNTHITGSHRADAIEIRLGLFFDGTGNNQHNTTVSHGKGASYDNALSNVALLHDLYAQQPEDDGQRVVLKHYVQGIGTQAGEDDDIYASATGRGRTGIQARVEQALADIAALLRDWQQGHRQTRIERISVDLFGFSRGAAAARHMANVLRNEPARLFPHCPIVIHFIGLFDTVAAIVAPLQGDFDPADTRQGGLQLGLPEGIANHVVQLVAGDEQRHNFPLIGSGHDIVLPGVHSNIGGGYQDVVDEDVLLCKPQSQRVAAGVPAQQTGVYTAVAALMVTAFKDLGQPPARVVSWEHPVPGGEPREPQKQVYAAIGRRRQVAGQLSRVYLSIMREYAARAGVPFAPLGCHTQHAVPEELRGISDKLHAYALGACPSLELTEPEQTLLRERYIHTSAHWNAVKGMRSSSLDVLFIDRPGVAGRVVHPNPV